MKTFRIFLPIFMILSIAFGAVQSVFTTTANICDKVLRLHIVANSNSTYDQNIKLELKDYFLENTKDIFTAKTIDGNIENANKNIDKINRICNEYLKKKKCTYKANVTVDNEFFKTRVYDDFTLPAGNYNCVKIELGEGNGHNWWCIVFPSVCLSACSESMSDYMSEDEMKLISSGYTPKFKVIEIYEELKNKLK